MLRESQPAPLVNQLLNQYPEAHPQLGLATHVAVDSRGNVIVVDHDNSRVLLFDDQLMFRRVVVDLMNYREPCRLCYRDDSENRHKLLVGFRLGVAVFDVPHH